MNWFERFISIDEFRVSALVLILIAIIGVVLVTYYTTGDVNPLLVNLVETLIYSIAGVNIVSGITSYANNKSQYNDSSNSNSSISYSNVDRSTDVDEKGTEDQHKV